jgi:hypothetical protein
MDLITHIDKNIKGLFLTGSEPYEFIDFTTRRDLYDIAHRFKRLYDIYICAQGYNFLHIKLLTDYGLIDVNIKRINYKKKDYIKKDNY